SDDDNYIIKKNDVLYITFIDGKTTELYNITDSEHCIGCGSPFYICSNINGIQLLFYLKNDNIFELLNNNIYKLRINTSKGYKVIYLNKNKQSIIKKQLLFIYE